MRRRRQADSADGTLGSSIRREAAPPCGRRHWDLRWSSAWGHETCDGRRRHADCAIGALGGAPYGATT
eukprot:1698841-Pyramimonas_sp.AAC.1